MCCALCNTFITRQRQYSCGEVTNDNESHSGVDSAGNDSRGDTDQTDNPMPWLDLNDELTGVDDRHPDAQRDSHPSDEWVSVARTGFKPSDADGKRDYWKWLERLHDGYGTYGTRSSALHEMGIRRDLDIVADRLGATELQRDQAQYLLEHIDIKQDILQSGPIEAAVIAVTSLVIDSERTERASLDQDVIPQSVTRDEPYGDLLDSYDLDLTTISTVRRKVRDTDAWARQE